MKRVSLTIALFLVIAQSALAATASPSGTPTQTIDKIKNLVKENIQDTENTIQKTVLTNSVIGTSGIIKTVGTKNITIENEKDLIQILVTDKTTITKANTEIKTSSLAINDRILAIGKKNKDDILEAVVINVLPPENPDDIVVSQSHLATISKIDLKKKTFILSINGEDLNFTLSKKTTVKLEDLKDGDTILGITKKYQGKYSLSRAIKI